MLTFAESRSLPRRSRSARPVGVAAIIGLLLVCGGVFTGLAGCQLVGGMAEAYKQGSTHEIKAEYQGLASKDFAVVVSADRYIQADHPELVSYLTTKMTERLADNKNVPRAGGFVPASDVLRYLYDNPGWTSKTMTDLAKGLGGVKRIVYIEVLEYQLHDPGNQYEWDAVASGTVSVVELDSVAPDDYAFHKQIAVKFPDKKGLGPTEIPIAGVTTALAIRFVDRATWLMYDHQEPYYPKY